MSSLTHNLKAKIVDWSKFKAFADDMSGKNHKRRFRKHSVKRRTFWLPAFSPFHIIFSKGLFIRIVKKRQLFGKGLIYMSDRAAESAEQDQTARMCRLVLLYNLRRTIPCSSTTGQRLSGFRLEYVTTRFDRLRAKCILINLFYQ